MSWIYQGFYIHNPLLLWPILALVLFMVVFIAAAIRTWRTNDPRRIEHLTQLPFDSETSSPQGGAPHA